MPRVGLEPTSVFRASGFESDEYANSSTEANVSVNFSSLLYGLTRNQIVSVLETNNVIPFIFYEIMVEFSEYMSVK